MFIKLVLCARAVLKKIGRIFVALYKICGPTLVHNFYAKIIMINRQSSL